MARGRGGDEGGGRVCVWLERKGAGRRWACSPRVRGTPTRIVAYTHNKKIYIAGTDIYIYNNNNALGDAARNMLPDAY